MSLLQVDHYEGLPNSNLREEGQEDGNHTADITHNEDENSGDQHRTLKSDNTFNLVYENIKTLPNYNDNSKNGTLRGFMLTHEFDIVGLSEVNKC